VVSSSDGVPTVYTQWLLLLRIWFWVYGAEAEKDPSFRLSRRYCARIDQKSTAIFSVFLDQVHRGRHSNSYLKGTRGHKTFEQETTTQALFLADRRNVLKVWYAGRRRLCRLCHIVVKRKKETKNLLLLKALVQSCRKSNKGARKRTTAVAHCGLDTVRYVSCVSVSEWQDDPRLGGCCILYSSLYLCSCHDQKTEAQNVHRQSSDSLQTC
jgi:hypothetical protein